jgi:hypothetical protein
VSTSPVAPPNYTELYGRVGIPVFIAILSAGLAGFASGRISLGVFLVLLGIGIVGLIVMIHLLKWYRFTYLHGFISAMTALLVSWAFLAYVIWTRPRAEDIENATAPIKIELKNEKQRADNTQIQIGQLQTQLETAEGRLAKASAQLGPLSPILKLDDARRWQIVKTMVEGMPEATQQGCNVDVAYDMSNQPEFHKSADVWSEVQLPLFFAGWRFHQIQKTFFPPGFSITVAAKTGYAHECAARLKDLLDQLSIRPSTVVVDQGATDLATCTNQCIQVAIGKLDTP